MNLWSGTVSGGDGCSRFTGAEFAVDLPAAISVAALADDSKIVVGVRPHDVDVTQPGRGDVEGAVELVETLGAWTTMHVRVGLDQELVRVATVSGSAARPGDRIGFTLRRHRLQLFDALTGRNLLAPSA
jgi:ABC-type sugar transport system ATPase subunit